MIAAGLGPPAYEDVDYIPLVGESRPGLLHRGNAAAAQLLRVLGAHRRGHWLEPDHIRRRNLLAGLAADVTVVNDALSLPVAFETAGDRPIVFDAHEYALVEFELSWKWRVLLRGHIRWILETYLPRTTSMMTVSREIARRYEHDSGIPATVVTNAPRYEVLEPADVTTPIRLVHFGWPDPMRRLGDTIEAVRLLGVGYSLDLYLICPESLRQEMEALRSRAARVPQVRLLDPVPMRQIPRLPTVTTSVSTCCPP